MNAAKTWKEKLGNTVPEAWAREIDVFETQIELRKKGKIEEKLFAETRLRRGTYGQRYDNGQRHDGAVTQLLAYPSGEISKGPGSRWDAPGLLRIKIPYGRLTIAQLETIADLAEEYSDRILHVTTRQDIQLHFIHIEDTPNLLQQLAAAGITTREACGNTVRNVTGCPYAGVCQTESFDVTPYAHAMTFFLLGHDDTQSFGRKFKLSFSGCKDQPCALANFHDIGCIARTRMVDGRKERGFEVEVGGGLGSVPQNAQLFDAFVPETAPLPAGPHPAGFAAWRATNLLPQAQAGYVMAGVTLPLGDLTSGQARLLADIARRFTGDTLRTTAEQNLLLRWVSEADLVALYQALQAADLAGAGAGTLTDIVACPGTDTCKLGISSSRALAAELGKQLAGSELAENPNAKGLHIKASGCFNACGQHHVADLGFLGVSRNVNGRRVPHFQLVVGGQWTNNAGSYGLAIGAVPSKRVPEVVKRLAGRFAAERQGDETFAAITNRIGKKTIRALVEEMQAVPPYEVDPSFYTDWGDPREYTIDDMGVGECAGEVVPMVEVGLADAEREIFESQILLEEKKPAEAVARAYSAMLVAARALTREKNPNLSNDPNEIVAEFRKHFCDTQLFYDPFAGPKFAQYFFRIHDEHANAKDPEAVHQLIEEATLFVDAAHQAYARLGASLGAPALGIAPGVAPVPSAGSSSGTSSGAGAWPA